MKTLSKLPILKFGLRPTPAELKVDLVCRRLANYPAAVSYLDGVYKERGCAAPGGARLMRLEELTTLGEAWNAASGWTPDWGDRHQQKHYPLFTRHADGRLRYKTCAMSTDYAGFAPCVFPTWRRAEQFGKRFEHLYNDVFNYYYQPERRREGPVWTE